MIGAGGITGSRSNLERLLKAWCEVENIQPDEPLRRWMFQNPSTILTRAI